MRAAGVPVVLLLTVWAGCLGDDETLPPVSPPRDDPYDLVNGFALPNNATGCSEAGVILLVEPAQAAMSLPPGFEPADASVILELPVAINKAAVYLNAVTCSQAEYGNESLEEGQISIFVLPPDVEGERSPATDFYEVVRFTPTEKRVEVLQAMEWTTFEGDIQLNLQGLPTGGNRGDGIVKDEQRQVYTFGAIAPSVDALAGVGRFWQDTPGGLAYFEYVLNAAIAQGTGSCSIRTGSVAHNVTGVTSCPAQDTLSIVIPAFDYTGEVRYLPGIRAH